MPAVSRVGLPNRIAIVSCGSQGEALALRQAIEEVSNGRMPVDLVGVGRCAHLIAALRGEASSAHHIVLCCHGDESGIFLPELNPSLAADEPTLANSDPKQ